MFTRKGESNRFRFEGRTGYMEIVRKYGTVVEAIFDAEDLLKILDSGVRKWYSLWSPMAQTYYVRGTLPGPIANDRTHVSFHRLLADTPEHLVTDHINWNALDNRRENLRNVTFAENIRHSRKRLNRPRGKGYSYNKKAKLWVVKINCRSFKSERRVKTEAEAKRVITAMRSLAEQEFAKQAA